MFALSLCAIAHLLIPVGAGEQVTRFVSLLEDRQIAEVLSHPAASVFMRHLAEAWPKLSPAARARLAAKLVPSLRSTTKVALTEAGDLNVTYRIKTGEMKGQGMGLTVDQDLYLTGGRAAFAISCLLSKDGFPDPSVAVLDGGLTADEWAKRADAIEAKVKAFAAIEAKDAPKK